MSTLRSLVAILLVGGLAAACATTVPQPSALLAYDRQDCAVGPDVAGAVSLTPAKERAVHVVNTLIDAGTPCLSVAGKTTPYLVYALPTDFADKTLTVGGLLEGNRVFSANVALLDSRGQVTRTFAAEEYFYRGAVHSVQFRPRPDETYVLVTSAPERVGQVYNSIVTGTQSTPVVTPVAVFALNSGTEAGLSRTFSYAGKVSVVVNDTETEESR